MADHGGEASGSSSQPRRVAMDPFSSQHGVPSTTHQATPKVRFSEEDIERASALTTAPEPPSLRLDNIARTSLETPPGLQPLRAAGPLSPTSPRNRDRGYSLRRSLFARSINNQSETSPIELVETGTLRGPNSTGRGSDTGKGKYNATVVTVDELVGAAGSSTVGGTLASQQQPCTTAADKKQYGTLSLPNYASWATTRAIRNPYWTKTKGFYEDLIVQRLLGQNPTPASKDGRLVDLDNFREGPLIDDRTGHEYMNNSIRSSRYTLWNFVPRQLLFQFSKLANAYFLLVSVLQMIPGLSTTGTYTTVAPLLVFVSISMAKEGYDDVRRYKLDKVENNKEAKVLRPYQFGQDAEVQPTSDLQLRQPSRRNAKETRSESSGSGKAVGSREEGQRVSASEHGIENWATVKWRDLKVGDIIKLKRDEDVPADMVILYADGTNGVAYVETMALDGETNLKSKQAPPPLYQQCGTLDGICQCIARIVVEDPNVDLYNFDGRVTVDHETLPLTTNEVIFRGSTLRNTPTLIGIIVNTGEECKIRMNANKNPRIKAPAIQAVTNKIIVMLVMFVILLSLFCTVAYQIWAENVEENSWYLTGAHVKFAQILIGFIILYNTLIPLSLYVSLEIIKVGQFLLMRDVEMYDPDSNTEMICNTNTILENLGQVDYIFSDKTGTLTDNVMKFRKLSVAGYAWLHDFDLQKEAAENQPAESKIEKPRKGKGVSKRNSKKKNRPTMPNRKDSEVTNSSFGGTEAPRRSGSVSLWKSSAGPHQQQPELRTEDLMRYMQHKPHNVFTKKAKFFLLSLALCHTCVPETMENGDIEFQAASPDEMALVKAAQELGYLVVDRAARTITLKMAGTNRADAGETIIEVYEILNVVEFSSKRKRMSIIVRFPNKRICIFCKGADSSILPRLKLAPLALQKASEVSGRSSKRKSLEAEEALRRMSEHSTRGSFGRTSTSIHRPSFTLSRKSIGYGRTSMASTRKLQPIRDELDAWLYQREHDVEIPDDIDAYESPRLSMGRPSFASSGQESSFQNDDLDDLLDEASVLDDAAVFERCFQHMEDFSAEGLRTLLFAYRFLDDQEYEDWKKIYHDATTSLVDRQRLIESAGEMIEQNFDLAGATAIEDKLQKGVPETIDKLRRANIKIWMLTGDKRETAINIAHSARICKNYSVVVILDHTTGEVEQRMATALLDITNGAIAHSVIVIDGQTLAEIDANETLAILFFDLVVIADSVICCRASPSQKASLVRKIRTKINRSITLAIGDGANDIAMIQEAHVGIGISGKEGLQAARIADYSIAQFRFLQKLLLVHGRWNYVRTSKYILLTFWKETVFYLLQALYQRWAGYTGTSLFESTSLTVFNTLFTSLPVLIIGIFEQDLNASTLLAVPELYVQGQRNEGFNIKKYSAWVAIAASESMIIYFIMWGLYGESLFSRDAGVLAMGQLCFTVAVIFINTKALLLEMHNKTIIPMLGFVISIGGWFAWNLFLAAIFKPSKTYPLYPIYRSFLDSYGRNLVWWLLVFLALASVVLLELGISSIRKTFWPCDTDVFQELQNDREIRERFEETVRRERDGGDPQAQMLAVDTLSHDARREGEIHDLLLRQRIMHGDAADDEIALSPSGVGERERASVHLTRRKVSMDASTALGGADREVPRTRHSIDVAEILSGRRKG